VYCITDGHEEGRKGEREGGKGSEREDMKGDMMGRNGGR
jgi:hypothetical protein